MENVKKPLILEIEEAKQKIIDDVNGAIALGVPCYLLAPILADVYNQVRNGATAEIEAAKKQMENTKQKAEKEK